MEQVEYKNIKSISFPNTVSSNEQSSYGNTMNKWEFKQVFESGEMAGIVWIAVFRDGVKIAHIKQSVCDIYFTQ